MAKHNVGLAANDEAAPFRDGLFWITASDTLEEWNIPQINVLTDWAHLAQIEEQGDSRLITKGQLTEYGIELKWLQNDSAVAASTALRGVVLRISRTAVAESIDPFRIKLAEYQASLFGGTPLGKTKEKGFRVASRLISAGRCPRRRRRPWCRRSPRRPKVNTRRPCPTISAREPRFPARS